VTTAELDRELAALAGMDGTALRARWVSLTRRAVPQASPALLRLALAWELQAAVLGGLPRRVSQQLDQLSAGKTRTQAAKPGMRLVREWNGTVHVVTIGDDGTVRWNERDWRSLSEVARAITGTRWSGPAFFGLRHKRAAA
jgi:hypothetical protein